MEISSKRQNLVRRLRTLSTGPLPPSSTRHVSRLIFRSMRMVQGRNGVYHSFKVAKVCICIVPTRHQSPTKALSLIRRHCTCGIGGTRGFKCWRPGSRHSLNLEIPTSNFCATDPPDTDRRWRLGHFEAFSTSLLVLPNGRL